MKRGLKSLKTINKYYHQIKSCDGFTLYEHNLEGDDCAYIVVNEDDNCYTYTWDDLETVISNRNDYTWFKYALIH